MRKFYVCFYISRQIAEILIVVIVIICMKIESSLPVKILIPASSVCVLACGVSGKHLVLVLGSFSVLRTLILIYYITTAQMLLSGSTDQLKTSQH